jgi:hypothetical protein
MGSCRRRAEKRCSAVIDSDTALPRRSSLVNADINIKAAAEIRTFAAANTTNTVQ